MFPSGNAHRRNHHKLHAVRLVVHLACGKGLYLIQEIFFIVFCYGVFSTRELQIKYLETIDCQLFAVYTIEKRIGICLKGCGW